MVVQRCPAVPTAPNTMDGHREFQVRRFVDDDGVVAAELEQRLAEPARHAFGHVAADGGGAGERHQRHAPVVDEAGRQLGAAIDEQLEDRR